LTARVRHPNANARRAALAVLYPSEAGKVRLLNGDMVTPAAFGVCIGRIDERLNVMGSELAGINQRLDRMDAYPRRWLYVGLLLAACRRERGLRQV
jgi:hypothetical protein